MNAEIRLCDRRLFEYTILRGFQVSGKNSAKGKAFPQTSCRLDTLRAYPKTGCALFLRIANPTVMESNPSNWPKLLIGAGVVLIVAGLLAWALQGKLNWLGRLPGDIRIERGNVRFYFPITTLILLSVLLNLLIWVVRRWWN